MSTEETGDRVREIGWAVNRLSYRLSYRLDSLHRAIRAASEDPTGKVLRPLAAHCMEQADWISGQLRDAAAKLLLALEGDPEPKGDAEPTSPPAEVVTFSADELEQLPRVEAGQLIECRRCGGKHALETVPTREGRDSGLLIYHCAGWAFLGAVDGADVTGSPGDGS